MTVVDCSFVVALISDPDDLTMIPPDRRWWAPTVLDAEFVNVLLRYRRWRRISEVIAEEFLEGFDLLGIERWPLDAATRTRMFVLGHRLSAYDAAYVAVAEALNAPLFTRDARLARTAADHVECHLV